MDDDEPRRRDPRDEPEPGGAESGDRPDGPPLPFAPDPDDDSALGDTDQHSDA